MVKRLLILLILVGILVSGCGISETNQKIKVEEDIRDIEFSCQSDNECDWIITNCCRENAGAFWQCANEIESRIVCPEGKYECAMEEKPKPTELCNCVDNKCQEKDFNFSYHVSVTEWVSGELSGDETGKKPIDTIIEEYRQSFNIIKISDDKVMIQHLFDKPNPCTNVNYTVSKIDSKINIIPKKIPDKPVYDPETGEELLTGCVQVIATDSVEVNLTLGTGKYDIYFYDYWDISKFSSNKTITIS